jgi:hypothetical protein
MMHDREDAKRHFERAPEGVMAYAFEALSGRTPHGLDEMLEAYRRITAAEIVQAIHPLLASGILFLPEGTGAPKGWRMREYGNRRSIEGETFRPARGSETAKADLRLTVGDEGLAFRFPDGMNRSYLWKRCVGVAWSEGYRVVICDDGAWAESSRANGNTAPRHWP